MITFKTDPELRRDLLRQKPPLMVDKDAEVVAVEYDKEGRVSRIFIDTKGGYYPPFMPPDGVSVRLVTTVEEGLDGPRRKRKNKSRRSYRNPSAQ